MKSLEFNMRFGEFELRACPKSLVRFANEPNVTIDIVRHMKDGDNERCYSIGYFYFNRHEPCWELKFVGPRFKEVSKDDIPVLWEMMKSAYDALETWSSLNEEE